jgi:hypothetical protein
MTARSILEKNSPDYRSHRREQKQRAEDDITTRQTASFVSALEKVGVFGQGLGSKSSAPAPQPTLAITWEAAASAAGWTPAGLAHVPGKAPGPPPSFPPVPLDPDKLSPLHIEVLEQIFPKLKFNDVSDSSVVSVLKKGMDNRANTTAADAYLKKKGHKPPRALEERARLVVTIVKAL